MSSSCSGGIEQVYTRCSATVLLLFSKQSAGFKQVFEKVLASDLWTDLGSNFEPNFGSDFGSDLGLSVYMSDQVYCSLHI